MRTIETTVYKFDELSDEAKQNALEKLYDINIDYDWWDFTYENAATIGLKLTGFDVWRGRDISGELTESGYDVSKLIMDNHGDPCDTYGAAKKYLEDYNLIKVKEKLLGTDEATEEADELVEELESDFEKELLNCYWKMLYDEYDYLQSDEAIKGTIEANDYEFEEDGTRV